MGVGEKKEDHTMLIDSGANVHVMSQSMVQDCHLGVNYGSGSKVITADKGGSLHMIGAVNVGGVVGMAKVSNNNSFNLLSVSKLQDSGGTNFI